jgi:hypothetical protein
VEAGQGVGPPEILVAGPGCARCDGLEQLVRAPLNESGSQILDHGLTVTRKAADPPTITGEFTEKE